MKKFCVFLMGFALISSLMAGCSGGMNSSSSGKDVSGDKDGAPAKAAANKESEGPVTLNFFTNGGGTVDGFNRSYGNAIMKKFPNYKIQYIPKSKGTEIPDLIAAGTSVDIYFESVGQFVDGLIGNQMQYDMTDLIKKHNVDMSRFESTSIDAMKAISNGKMYGLPVYNISLATYYNKDIFDKFGVPYLKDGMSWDDMIEAGHKLTRSDGEKSYYGLAASSAHVLRLNPFSIPYIDPKTEKPTISNDKWKLIFENAFLRPAEPELYKQNMQSNKNALPAGSQFTNDKNLAIYVALSNIFTSNVEPLSTMKWDMVSVPVYKEMPNVGAQLYPVYFSVTSLCKNKDAAMEVIKYLTSDEFQTEFTRNGDMTVLKSDAVRKEFGKGTPFKDKNLQSVFYYKFAPISPKTIYDSVAEKSYRKNIVDMIMGKIDINSAFRQAEEETNKAIAEMKSE